jgi:hypothetical protein
MSDQNRGIMKFDNADSPLVITVSAFTVLGAIALLLVWAEQVAYHI